MKNRRKIFSVLLPVLAALFICTSCAEVKLSAGLQKLGMEAAESEDGKFLTLGSREGDFSFLLRRESGTVNAGGVPVIVPEAVTFSENGGWDVPEWIVENLFIPLKNPAAANVRKILLDPGHGGRDNGAVGLSGRKEKELNLALASELKRELQLRGFEVLMTRESDKYVPLGERGVAANRLNADLFISIHHNAARNPDASGFEVFLIDPRGSGAEKYLQLKKSARLAWLMQKEQFSATGSMGRGVKFARFRVLRDAECPAVLVEAGFLSNASEEFRCADPLFRKSLAKSLADAVSGYASL